MCRNSTEDVDVWDIIRLDITDSIYNYIGIIINENDLINIHKVSFKILVKYPIAASIRLCNCYIT